MLCRGGAGPFLGRPVTSRSLTSLPPSETRIRGILCSVVRQALLGSGCSAEPGDVHGSPAGCARSREKQAVRGPDSHAKQRGPGADPAQQVRAGLRQSSAQRLPTAQSWKEVVQVRKQESPLIPKSKLFTQVCFSPVFRVELVLCVPHILLSWNLISEIFPMTVSLFLKHEKNKRGLDGSFFSTNTCK